MSKIKPTKTKFTVIIGYVLVMGVMALGLIALYNNLVDYSNKKIDNKDLSELLTVSNTLSLLYEIESEQNFISAESAEAYFHTFDSITPVINDNLKKLKTAATDSTRAIKLDSIALLVALKKENLLQMSILLDSLRRAPVILRQTESSFVPKELNREITEYLESKDFNAPSLSRSDTSVVVGERRRFLDRVRDVFDGRADSTIVIESRAVVADTEFRLIVDTLINKVRYSERLDLDRQRKFQQAFFERQELISQTNRMLTGRIDDLLKEIEQEEMVKSVQLLVDKEEALSRSENTMQLASIGALAIALVFGLLLLMDINKSQRYRKELEESNKKISGLLRARERLMLTISHDIKAPMSSILGYLELMENNGNHTEKNREYVANMQQSGDHVLQLVASLLDNHKLESGTWQMRKSTVNLHSLVEETAQSFKPMAATKGLTFQIENKIDKSTTCFADPYVLRQIISNLISNAIKYTPEGKVQVLTRSEEEAKEVRLFVTVKDTGLGIAKEDQETIFHDFTQLSGASETSRAEGSGLGLAITRRFVDEMKGTLSLESEVNSGSEFTVSIPFTVLENKDLAVLVVDNDPVHLTMVAEMMELAGVNGTVEKTACNVLDKLREKRYDAIFLDLQMPEMSGIELVQLIRASGIEGVREVPIVALSAQSDVEVGKLQKAGFNGFLGKPFTFNQFQDTIHQYTGTAFPDRGKIDEPRNGVHALIEFVQEDKEASIEILKSYAEQVARHRVTLTNAFDAGDLDQTKEVAHTLLPLVKMVGDPAPIECLQILEKKKKINDTQKDVLLHWLQNQEVEAQKLMEELIEERA